MSDDPGREPEQRLPARRPPSEPAPVERFSAPPSAHAGDLSPERSAAIVRQSASARWVGFIAVVVVILFTIAYYFYEVGLPLGLSTPRVVAEADAQQVTAVEQGYNLYQANCAKCHGPNGKGTDEGYIAPPLNDPMKLFDHLNATYIKNVLTAGGRYVCGNANSIMPVWADTNGGPLNYVQIQNLIAFIRSDATQTYTIRNPTLNEPVIGPDGKVETFKGWVDPNFKPAADATAVPACWSGSGGGTAPSSGPIPSGETVLNVTALNIAFDTQRPDGHLRPAVRDRLQEPGCGRGPCTTSKSGHRTGRVLQEQPTIDGGQETTYQYTALQPGTYTFICKIHPIPNMTGTLTVK